MSYNEDTLTQQTMADYLSNELGWDSVYAYNTETFGPEGTLGRKSDRDVLLTRHIGEALHRLNPGLPDEAYMNALRQITDTLGFQSIVQTNREKYELIAMEWSPAITKAVRSRRHGCGCSISIMSRTTIFSASASCGCAVWRIAVARTLWAL
jgi:hypothetical protein